VNDSRGRFFEDEQKRLVKFIYMKIGNWEDASDIAQDVFVKYLKKFEDANNRDYHRKWLYSVARTTIIDRWRTGQRDWLEQASSLDGHGNGGEDDGSSGSGVGIQIPDPDPLPGEDLIRREDLEESAGWRALKKLSDRDRDLLLLREDLKWSYPDIMIELEMSSINAVGRALSRARRRLRELAEEE